jgi:hypothetical protein
MTTDVLGVMREKMAREIRPHLHPRPESSGEGLYCILPTSDCGRCHKGLGDGHWNARFWPFWARCSTVRGLSLAASRWHPSQTGEAAVHMPVWDLLSICWWHYHDWSGPGGSPRYGGPSCLSWCRASCWVLIAGAGGQGSGLRRDIRVASQPGTGWEQARG